MKNRKRISVPVAILEGSSDPIIAKLANKTTITTRVFNTMLKFISVEGIPVNI